MEIILLQDVDKLGEKGEVATVSEGYARNYLLPRKLAERATPGRIAQVRKMMEEKVAQVRREAERADETRDLLSKTVLTVAAAVGTGDRLFGSVTSQDIADAIYAARKIRIDKRNVDLEEPIKTAGAHMVKVHVHASVEPAEVKVIVAPEEQKA
ncbi:MAG: 50S ribosomal protein L9 [Thermoleophilia bacterium]|nr:50S ribosomal protein L9 [Thermoleophilia bacterium]